MPTTVQVGRAALDSLVRDGLFARRGDEGSHHSFQQVLVDPAVFVQKPKRGLEAMRERLALGVRQALVVHAPNPVHDADMARFRQERRVVNEAPERQKAVHTSGVTVVTEDTSETYQGVTSISTRSCFPGS